MRFCFLGGIDGKIQIRAADGLEVFGWHVVGDQFSTGNGDAGVNDGILVSAAGGAGIWKGRIGAAHHHRDFAAKVFCVKFESFAAVSTKIELRLQFHPWVSLPNDDGAYAL